MGDVLHAMPAVAALRELHPEWEIHWAIEPRWSTLLASGCVAEPAVRGACMPLVNGWHAVRTRIWQQRPFSWATVADIRGLRAELRAERFDVCVDMQGLIRSAVVGRMAGATRFVGRDAPREGVAKILYGQRVKVSATHVVEQGCEVLGAAVGESLRPARVPLPMDAVAEAWCDGVVAKFDRRRCVMIAPTAGWGAKEWPVERYGAVAAELGRAGFGVVVNAVGDSDPTAAAVVRASEGAALAVPCSISQMIALMRRSCLFIAGDTGPLHLAAALERPVVGIYGPTDPARTGPYGVGTVTPGVVLRDGSSVTDHRRHRVPEAGLLRIRVDEVVEAALSVLR